MIIYEPVESFKIQREELEELCAAVVDVWPSEISFTDKRFGAFEQYKCGSFTQAYQRAEETFESRLERGEFGKWGELAPIVFDFVARAIKHASVYLQRLDTSQVDSAPIITDMSAREDIVIDERGDRLPSNDV